MARAAIENGMKPGILYDFQGFAADCFTDPKSPYASQDSVSAVRIYPEVVTVDDNTLALPRAPSLVFDYGACLTGRSYMADQMQFLRRGQRPFTYSPLARQHFTNQTLINTYEARYGPEIAKAIFSNQLYIGREDGIAAATDEVIRAQQEHNAPVDIADIILATGIQHAAPQDVKIGIENAYSLLKEGGMLVLRALARPAVDELGTDAIAKWAFDAGFEEGNAIHYEADLDRVGTLLQTGHFGKREIKAVILTK